MAKFQFRLATLRKLRVAHRDEMQAKLSEALQAEDILGQQIGDLRLEMESLQDVRRKALNGDAADVNQLLETQRYFSVLRAQQSTMEAQAKLLAAEVERRRQTLTEANREVRVLDNLEERRRRAHKLQMERVETKELDEIASQRKASDIWA